MFVGSMNLDRMALKINNEIGILFHNPQIAGQSAQDFNEYIGNVAFRLELHADDNGGESIRWHLQKGGPGDRLSIGALCRVLEEIYSKADRFFAGEIFFVRPGMAPIWAPPHDHGWG